MPTRPMMSFVTPLHAPGNKYIEETWASLLAQKRGRWEWVIVENNGGKVPKKIAKDPRVRVLVADNIVEGVGALKRMACLTSRGEWIVELDADDLLLPGAIRAISRAFKEGADFVYSDFAQFEVSTDGSWVAKSESYPYGEAYGWKHYEARCMGRRLWAMRAPPVTAQNLRDILWAPNHVRAWTRESYLEVGGHDQTYKVADDFDLVVRFYLAGKKFTHVPECLYLYRAHDANTVKTQNSDIRRLATQVYNRSIWAMAEKWTKDNGLALVDLCGGPDPAPGYRSLDLVIPKGVDGARCDLDRAWTPLKTSSVGVIRAHDAVEHLRDSVHTMNEAHRVLAPGGFFMIMVPSTGGVIDGKESGGKGAFCDPTHVSFWNDLSFRYYTDHAFALYLPKLKAKFHVSRVLHFFPTEWHRENSMPYVEAHLICLKPGYEPMGEVGWPNRGAAT